MISKCSKKLLFTLCLAAFSLHGGVAQAQSNEDLVKATANPVANMISVPIQNNWDKGYGPGNNTQYTMNVQPVIPFQVNSDWNLITRTIMPIMHQPALSTGQGDAWGVGDITASFFFSPRVAQNGLIWGAGPVLLLPTASKDRLGTERWAGGPTGVMLIQDDKWTYGALANHVWSFAGNSDRRKINATFLNPFVSYSLGGGWSTTAQAEVTYDWDAASGKRATIPLSIMVGKVTNIGSQPVSLGIGYRHYVETPNGKPDYGIRFVASFLFPK